jgi:hypothetical protein
MEAITDPLASLFFHGPQPTAEQVARAVDVARCFLPEIQTEQLTVVAEAILVEHMRIRLADALPMVSAPRGAIRFLPPPGPPTWLDRVWRQPVRRALRPWRAVKVGFVRVRAARRRAHMAAQVWRGEMTAISHDRLAELEEME